MQIVWKAGTQHKVDAATAYEAIEVIRKRNGGEASAEAIVKAAAAKRNPLRAVFEWDDAVAGHEHRLQQAREIVRHLVVVREDVVSDRPQRVYEAIRVRDTAEPPGGRIKNVYMKVDDVMANPELRSELLGRALRELIAIRNRYRDLQELAVVLRAIDEVVATAEV